MGDKTKDQLIEDAKKLDPDFVVGDKTKADIEKYIVAMSTPKTEKDEVRRVAKGRALTVPEHGVVGEGEVIKASMLPEGEEQLKYLMAKGFIV